MPNVPVGRATLRLFLAWTMVMSLYSLLSDWSSASAQQAAAETPEPTTILLTEYALGPSDVVVAVGEVRLRLVNAGIRRHTLTVLVGGVEHSSPEVRPGDAAEWLLHIHQPGRYELWCNEYRHLEKGMGGALFVR
jgi:plastocyanin